MHPDVCKAFFPALPPALHLWQSEQLLARLRGLCLLPASNEVFMRLHCIMVHLGQSTACSMLPHPNRVGCGILFIALADGSTSLIIIERDVHNENEFVRPGSANIGAHDVVKFSLR